MEFEANGAGWPIVDVVVGFGNLAVGQQGSEEVALVGIEGKMTVLTPSQQVSSLWLPRFGQAGPFLAGTPCPLWEAVECALELGFCPFSVLFC